ncbi:MAG: hypothetical protein PF445_13185 [Melioribacteraceae bacterium]|jgi:hypothetical protein|nr:hypothetical protein [Melioribacteraceae bacterium]
MDNLLESNDQIIKDLSDLNKRISRIESHLDISNQEYHDETLPDKNNKKTEEEKKSLEFEIGQFWFAKAGIVVLALGIALVLSLPFDSFPSFIPSLFGFIIAIILFGVSKLWRNSFDLISRYLFGSAFLLLFFSTLRLHYWGNNPFITNLIIEAIPLLIIASFLLFISIKKESSYLFNIGLTLGFISALVSGETYIIFLGILGLTALSSYIKIHYEWGRLFYYTIFLSYLTHLLWFINNPLIIGNKIGLVSEPYVNIFFLMSYLILIAIGNIYRKSEFGDEKQNVISSFINSFGFIILFAFISLTQFKSEITISFTAVSILFLLLAFLYWKKEMAKYSIFFFSMFGYAALSTSIINIFDVPDVFIWLCWQSILVVSTAILFRSKIIILANFLIYLAIAIATMSFSGNSAISCINIGIVALLSARILNSQKDRLDLKTESMRNAYLTIAFLLLPYSTFLLVPIEYVGLTWLAIAILYYVFSVFLNNKKYRWMAIITLAITILYTLLLGILHPDNELKVLSFIIVGGVLIAISIVYTKIKSKDKIENRGD